MHVFPNERYREEPLGQWTFLNGVFSLRVTFMFPNTCFPTNRTAKRRKRIRNVVAAGTAGLCPTFVRYGGERVLDGLEGQQIRSQIDDIQEAPRGVISRRDEQQVTILLFETLS